jgi:hypothetical protein
LHRSTNMRVAAANQIPRKSNGQKGNGSFIRAPISIERPKELFSFTEEGSHLEMKLRSTPTDENSPTYSLKMPIFKTGSAEQWFHWRMQFKVVLRGQNLTTGNDQFAMARRLLTGEALTRFNNEANNQRAETVASLERCLQTVTDYVLPKFALAHQKRYLRRLCRKPQDMPIKQYYARYKEINDYLALFNDQGVANKLDNDEIKEHLNFSIPNRWQKEMIMHGFEPIEGSIDEFLEFCERLEVTEGIYNEVHKKPAGMPDLGNSPSSRKRASQSSNATTNAREYFCLYHGENSSHDTDQCKVIKPQVDRLRASHEPTKKFTHRKNFFKNNPTTGPNGTNKDSTNNTKNTNHFNGLTETFKHRTKRQKTSGPKVAEMDNFNYENFRSLNISDSDDESTSE